MPSTNTLPKIPGTTPFDGEQAQKGYALNRMCFSFNSAENRAEFQKDEEAYMRKYGCYELKSSHYVPFEATSPGQPARVDPEGVAFDAAGHRLGETLLGRLQGLRREFAEELEGQVEIGRGYPAHARRERLETGDLGRDGGPQGVIQQDRHERPDPLHD